MSLLEGFKFGMLLQIAVGPVCMYIFSLGTSGNFLKAHLGVWGVVLADGIYIVLAIMGLSSFIKSAEVQKKFNILGSLIIIYFGLELVLGYFGFSIVPKINIFGNIKSDLPFLKALILTAANPMSILFWMGIFSTKISDKVSSKKETFSFALGALLATLIFLNFVAFLGSLTNDFLPKNTLNILNLVVGAVLIYFGIKKLKVKN